MKVKDILKFGYLMQVVEIANKTEYYFGKLQDVPEWLAEYDVVYIAAGYADSNPNTVALLIDAEPSKILDEINEDIKNIISVDKGVIQSDGSTIYTVTVTEQMFKELQDKYGSDLDETLSKHFEEYVTSIYNTLVGTSTC